MFYDVYRSSTFGYAAATIGVAASRERSVQRALQDLDHAAHALQTIHDRAEDPEKASTIAGYLAEVRRLRAFVGVAFAVLKCTASYDEYRDKLDSASLEEFTQDVD